MRLYKMELFKLFQNKIFKIGMLAATGLLFLYFWFAEVGGEIATVDGKFYSGYEAVQMNRKIGLTRRFGKRQIRHSIRPSEWIRWWLRVILQRRLPAKRTLSDN